MYIHSSDKHIGYGIYVSASVLYSKNVAMRNKAMDILTLINRTEEEFRKLLNYPTDIKFRVAPIKGRTNGRYMSTGKLVEIDSNLDWAKALEVLAHELVHAEQYHTGKLTKRWVNNKGWMHSWNGDLNKNRGSTYKAYRNQPWEQEAWSRQAELAEIVCSALEKKYEE